VAHFHYTFFPIAIIGVYSAISYWYPKMFGRFMNEKWNKVHFWGTIIPFNFIFIPLFFLGLAGQHRRIYDFSFFPELATADLQQLRVVATAALVIMMLFQVVFWINFFVSLKTGKVAGKNPWKANTLEWTAVSPPPHGNWPPSKMPVVYRGPYEYSHPDSEEDYWPQNAPT
jgi:cytochrome c oxidase subunit 1